MYYDKGRQEVGFYVPLVFQLVIDIPQGETVRQHPVAWCDVTPGGARSFCKQDNVFHRIESRLDGTDQRRFSVFLSDVHVLGGWCSGRLPGSNPPIHVVVDWNNASYPPWLCAFLVGGN